ncbi:MAG TPA: hypothetical protein VIK33_08060 [Anaerolineae bacterium]
MPKAIDANFELTVARSMLAELEDYLKSDLTYWQTAPNALGDRMPQLTIGGLLESLLRAEATGASDVPPMRAALQSIQARRLDRVLVHIEHEARSRLNSWAWYLDDQARNPEEAASHYPNEVRARLKAELLLNELERESRGQTERRRAEALDERLRQVFVPGAFVWDERLKPFLPEDQFWWLYGKVRS